MKIAIINPNTTAAMSDLIHSAAASVACPSTEIVTYTAPHGPESIEGYFDEYLAGEAVLTAAAEVVRKEHPDAIIDACYTDPALYGCRELCDCPVIGVGEASMYFAAILAAKFSVVTDLQRGVHGLEALASKYGMDKKCVSVRATNIPVLGFDQDDSSINVLIATSRLAMNEDGAEAICLGCAGLAAYAARMQELLGIPVLDGVTAAVKIAEGLVTMGKSTSKLCTFSYPNTKEYRGYDHTFEIS